MCNLLKKEEMQSREKHLSIYVSIILRAGQGKQECTKRMLEARETVKHFRKRKKLERARKE